MKACKAQHRLPKQLCSIQCRHGSAWAPHEQRGAPPGARPRVRSTADSKAVFQNNSTSYCVPGIRYQKEVVAHRKRRQRRRVKIEHPEPSSGTLKPLPGAPFAPPSDPSLKLCQQRVLLWLCHCILRARTHSESRNPLILFQPKIVR